MGIAGGRDGNTHFTHDAIGNIFPHVAGIPIVVIQIQLFQAVVIFTVIKIIKIYLKTVAVRVRGRYRCQGVIALCPQCHIGQGFPVDGHIHGVISFFQWIFHQIRPIFFADFNIDFIDDTFREKILQIRIFLRFRVLSGCYAKDQKGKNHQSKSRQQEKFIFPQSFHWLRLLLRRIVAVITYHNC